MGKKFRYPGAAPFSGADGELFFGRYEDINQLSKLIDIEQIVVLYGKSGLGKSSLINAGLNPKLRKESNFYTYNIRFGGYVGGADANMPVETIAKKIAKDRFFSNYLDKLRPEKDTLWYYFKSLQIERGPEYTPLLFIDQFEELFTYPDEHISAFKRQMEELLNPSVPLKMRKALRQSMSEDEEILTNEEMASLYKPLKVKLLIAIRSDKISLLNKLQDVIPNILHCCYELEALDAEEAEDAIVNPAIYDKVSDFASPIFHYKDDALQKMLDFLTSGGRKKIESFQLQILCQYVENLVIRSGKTVITTDDLGDLKNIYQNYYDFQMEQFSAQERAMAQKLIEEGLIFMEEERRISLYEGQIFSVYKISKELLGKLVDTHILRAEPSPDGGFTYEISHDTLVGPILKSKIQRLEAIKRAKEEAERSRKMQEKLNAEMKQKSRFRKMTIGAIVAFVAVAILGGWLVVYFQNYYYAAVKEHSEAVDKKNQEITSVQLSKDSLKNELVKLSDKDNTVKALMETRSNLRLKEEETANLRKALNDTIKAVETRERKWAEKIEDIKSNANRELKKELDNVSAELQRYKGKAEQLEGQLKTLSTKVKDYNKLFNDLFSEKSIKTFFPSRDNFNTNSSSTVHGHLMELRDKLNELNKHAK